MTLYRAEIHKQAENRKFANDYLLEATDLGAAAQIAQAFAAMERQLFSPAVTLLDIRVSTAAPSDRVFTHVTLNEVGTGSVTEVDLMPAYCCLRVDFGTASGDPGHKYYRYVCHRQGQSHGQLLPVWLTTFQNIVTAAFTGDTASWGALRIGKSDATPVNALVNPFVQERQEHRRKKKPTIIGV